MIFKIKKIYILLGILLIIINGCKGNSEKTLEKYDETHIFSNEEERYITKQEKKLEKYDETHIFSHEEERYITKQEKKLERYDKASTFKPEEQRYITKQEKKLEKYNINLLNKLKKNNTEYKKNHFNLEHIYFKKENIFFSPYIKPDILIKENSIKNKTITSDIKNKILLIYELNIIKNKYSYSKNIDYEYIKNLKSILYDLDFYNDKEKLLYGSIDIDKKCNFFNKKYKNNEYCIKYINQEEKKNLKELEKNTEIKTRYPDLFKRSIKK